MWKKIISIFIRVIWALSINWSVFLLIMKVIYGWIRNVKAYNMSTSIQIWHTNRFSHWLYYEIVDMYINLRENEIYSRLEDVKKNIYIFYRIFSFSILTHMMWIFKSQKTKEKYFNFPEGNIIIWGIPCTMKKTNSQNALWLYQNARHQKCNQSNRKLNI